MKDGKDLRILKFTRKQEYIDQINNMRSNERDIIPPVAYNVPCRLYKHQSSIYVIPGLKLFFIDF